MSADQLPRQRRPQPDDDQATADVIDAAARRIAAKAPPLTAEQAQRLGHLFRIGGGDAA